MDVEWRPGRRSLGLAGWDCGLAAPDLVKCQGQVHVHPVSFESRKPHVLAEAPDTTLSIRRRPADPDKTGSPRRISLERHRHHGVLSGRRETGRKRSHHPLNRRVQNVTSESIRIPVERARAGRSGGRARGGDWPWIRIRPLTLWASEAKAWQPLRGLTHTGRRRRGRAFALGKGRRRPSSNAQKLTSDTRQCQCRQQAKRDWLACQTLQEPSPHSPIVSESRAHRLTASRGLPRAATDAQGASRDARAGVVSSLNAHWS